MGRRRSILVASIIASLILHALLMRLAPRFTIIDGANDSADAAMRFHVDLTDLVAAPEVRPQVEDPEAARASLRDLLQSLEPPEMPESFIEPVVVPNVAERLQEDEVERDHDLAADETNLAAVDARILEIAREEAREGLNVTRTTVAPSAQRLLREGEAPVFRGPGDPTADEVLMVDPLASAVPLGSGGPSLLPRPEGMTDLDPIAPMEEPQGLPELPIEEQAVREPVLREIASDVRAESMDDLMAFELQTYVPPGASEGYYRLRVIPRAEARSQALPKDVTFVVDASSSIVQRKLDLAARGIRDSLATLRADDRFNVIIFRDSATAFRAETVPASEENLRAVGDFLKGIESRGETDVYTALEPVLADLPRPGYPGVVVVITDGRPTTGLQDGRAIINALSVENDRGNSVFAVTAGRTVNRYLLDLLSYRNKGEAVVSDNIEDLGGLVPRFVETLQDPLLVDLDASFSRVNETDVYPKTLPDLYGSRALALYGTFDPASDDALAVRVKGQAGDRQKDVLFRSELDEAQRGGEDIARGWAFQKIYYLIGEMSRVGETPELLQEVRALSRRYGVRTSYDE